MLRSRSPEHTRRLGESLGRAAQAGDVFLLDGPFGAGKTVLVQGLATGLAVQDYVSSPSFIMVNEHQGRLPLYHVDLYRFDDKLDPEMLETLEETLGGRGVCAVEWPALLPRSLRAGATELLFISRGESSRDIEIESPAQHLAAAASEAGAIC